MSQRCTECGGQRPGTGQGAACVCDAVPGAEDSHRERVRPYLGPHVAGAPPTPAGPAYEARAPRIHEAPTGYGQADRQAGEDFSTTAAQGVAPPPAVGPLAVSGRAHEVTAPLPKVSDLDLFPPDERSADGEGQHGTTTADITPPASGARPRRTAARAARRRRAAVLGVSAGAVVVVALAGAVATDSLPDERPEERALPTPSATAPRTIAPGPATPSAPGSPAPSSPAAPSATASSALPSATPGQMRPAASPTPAAGPDGPAPPKPSTSRTPAEPSTAPSPEQPPQEEPVLRRGDSGPQVRELQQRLQQLHLYRGRADGDFGRRLEDALRTYQWARGLHGSLGVYDGPTRRRLESETSPP